MASEGYGSITSCTQSNQRSALDSLHRSSVAGSWLETFQSLTGSKPHKPSFVVLDIGQSGLITLMKWFAAHHNVSFQADILSKAVRFPRMSVYQRIRQSSGDVYGFSINVKQLREVQRLADPNQFLRDLHRGGCRIIYLHRRDMLRHVIATLRTYTSDHNENFTHPQKQSKFIVDVSELIACLTYLDNQRLEANAILHNLPHLSLVYEDDLMDPNSYLTTAQKLSDYLDIPNLQPASSALKLVHQRITDIVENYEEIHSGIEASDYAYLLTDSRHLLTR